MCPLEMFPGVVDHCRIGSLEMGLLFQPVTNEDHCRIGSLEMFPLMISPMVKDHCRIGSLENLTTS